MAPLKSARANVKNMMSFDPSNFITVIVGKEPGQQRFSVNKEIICRRSEFCKRAMNGNWVELEERTVRLPEDDPDIFKYYVKLVYTGLVLTNHCDEPKTQDILNDEIAIVSGLYVLGEELQDKATKNSALETLLEIFQEKDKEGLTCVPSADSVRRVYEGTCAGNLGRRLMVDSWVRVCAQKMAADMQVLPKDFPGDLAIARGANRLAKKPKLCTMANKSRYMEEEA